MLVFNICEIVAHVLTVQLPTYVFIAVLHKDIAQFPRRGIDVKPNNIFGTYAWVV